MTTLSGPLNKRFKAKLQRSPAEGGWTYVVMQDSAAFFALEVWSRSAAPSTAIHSEARSWLWETAHISCPSNRIFENKSARRKAIPLSFTYRNESEAPESAGKSTSRVVVPMSNWTRLSEPVFESTTT